MTKAFDLIDRFFGAYFSGIIGWLAVLVLGVIVVVLERLTHSNVPMFLLAVPGLYMMGRNGGTVQIVKFCFCIGIVLLILAITLDRMPCDGFGQGLRMFYRIECQ